MAESDSTVVDLVERSATDRQTVHARLDARVSVLRHWLESGLPFGQHIPKDLKAARLWNDPALGILKVSSPNEFTTNHLTHGATVRLIKNLLTQLHEKFGAPEQTSKSESSASVSADERKIFEDQLKAAVSNWHSQRDARVYETNARKSAEARLLIINEELLQKDNLISDLRREISASATLKAVR